MLVVASGVQSFLDARGQRGSWMPSQNIIQPVSPNFKIFSRPFLVIDQRFPKMFNIFPNRLPKFLTTFVYSFTLTFTFSCFLHMSFFKCPSNSVLLCPLPFLPP